MKTIIKIDGGFIREGDAKQIIRDIQETFPDQSNLEVQMSVGGNAFHKMTQSEKEDMERITMERQAEALKREEKLYCMKWIAISAATAVIGSLLVLKILG